jgi:hypothetical protein
MRKIALSGLLLQAVTANAATTNTLKPVWDFQTDSWSCGVHSTYRSLNHYDLATSYGNMKAFIGQQEFKYNITKEITERVKSKVCKKLGPLKHFCEEVTKVVTRVTTVKIPMRIGIGRGPHQLAGKITDFGVRSIPKEKASFADLERLIDQKKPVLTLLQIDVEGWELLSFPKLHWVVVTGYDANNIYYYDTDSNDLVPIERGEFYQQWDWNNGWNKRNSPVHLHLTRNEGIEIRSIIYFDDEKIDRILMLEKMEASAAQRLAQAFAELEGHLENPKVFDVTRKVQEVAQLHGSLDIQVNQFLDSLDPVLSEP